jgi:hypothetical protein
MSWANNGIVVQNLYGFVSFYSSLGKKLPDSPGIRLPIPTIVSYLSNFDKLKSLVESFKLSTCSYIIAFSSEVASILKSYLGDPLYTSTI